MGRFQSFWFGDQLSPYQQLAMKSFVDRGHEYVLYAYKTFDTPPGVELCDAGAILPQSRVFFYGDRAGPGRGAVSGFANLFRYHLLTRHGGWWVDADVVCLSEMVPPDDIFLGWESDYTIGNAILKFPAQHDFVRELRDRADQAGSNLAWGETGPLLLTRLARERNMLGLTSAKGLAYPIPFTGFFHLLDPSRYDELSEALANKPFLHLWNEMFRRAVIFQWMAPPPGSLLAELLKCHDIGFESSAVYTADQIGRLAVNAANQMCQMTESARLMRAETLLRDAQARMDILQSELAAEKARGEALRREVDAWPAARW